MTFAEILPFLKEGFAVRRDCYDASFIIFKQIPATIDDASIVKSIPSRVKTILTKHDLGIDYQDQYLLVLELQPIVFLMEMISMQQIGK